MFQSTHPHGVRHNFSSRFLTLVLFQSTHPHGVRLRSECDKSVSVVFQSTHPHGVRLCGSKRVPDKVCFNPRTHMGCDNLSLRNAEYFTVSIHAPTWGATSLHPIHFGDRMFQSTHPHGVRPDIRVRHSVWTDVSIHAPTWGATISLAFSWRFSSVSIHAPTWGATYHS